MAQAVKIILDESLDRTDLMSTKQMDKESDVFLIDHMWSFRFQDMADTLKLNPSLLARLEQMQDNSDKQELPQSEEKKEKSVEQVFEESVAKGGKVFDLDEMGITSLAKIPQFPDTAEEISLWGNEIINPNELVKILVPLPNLKALWLNGNPMVNACANFNSIAELMPKLEILNSQLTAKAGEWAILFYARDQGATSLDQITTLDLSGKGVLFLQSTDVFERMTSLRKLDIRDHPEFFMTDEAKEGQ